MIAALFSMTFLIRGVMAHVECEGGKFKDIPIKFETFNITNSKSPKIFRRNSNNSENPIISKKLGCHGPMPRRPCF